MLQKTLVLLAHAAAALQVGGKNNQLATHGQLSLVPRAAAPLLTTPPDERNNIVSTMMVRTDVGTSPLPHAEINLPAALDSPAALDAAGANSARALLVAVTLVYSTNYPTVKLMNDWLSSAAEVSVLRFGVAFAALLPVLAVLGCQSPRFLSAKFARDGMLVGACFAAAYAAQATALQTSNAGLQAFLCGLSVLWCPVLESLVDGKHQPARVWVAALLAVGGIGTFELGGLLSGGGGLDGADLIGLVQPIGFGSGFFLLERAMATHQENPGDDASGTAGASDLLTPLALTAWEFVAILPLCLVWLSTTGGEQAITHLADSASTLLLDPGSSPMLVGALLWTGVVTTALACVAETAALGKLSSSDATVIFSLEPLGACVFAYLMLSESVDASCMVGGALMLSACLVSGSDMSLDQMPTPRWLAGSLVQVRRGCNRAVRRMQLMRS